MRAPGPAPPTELRDREKGRRWGSGDRTRQALQIMTSRGGWRGEAECQRGRGAWTSQGPLLPGAALVLVAVGSQDPVYLPPAPEQRRRARGLTPPAAGQCKQPASFRCPLPLQSPGQWPGDQKALGI